MKLHKVKIQSGVQAAAAYKKRFERKVGFRLNQLNARTMNKHSFRSSLLMTIIFAVYRTTTTANDESILNLALYSTAHKKIFI